MAFLGDQGAVGRKQVALIQGLITFTIIELLWLRKERAEVGARNKRAKNGFFLTWS